MIEIYTDGGYCIPKEIGGWAMVVVVDDRVKYTKSDTVKNSTSNRMEMTAFLTALQYTDEPVTIITDSNYVVQGYNNWSHNWKKKNWKKSDGKEILNKDLWEAIDAARRDNVTVRWTKGHSKAGTREARYNELVDSLTRNYI
ncbi:MAG: ribonuclease HI [Sphaerochaetaceae bacterium]|nr:ribonuclease HI [Sphaerochaetaceae bacterium]